MSAAFAGILIRKCSSAVAVFPHLTVSLISHHMHRLSSCQRVPTILHRRQHCVYVCRAYLASINHRVCQLRITGEIFDMSECGYVYTFTANFGGAGKIYVCVRSMLVHRSILTVQRMNTS
ncbi:hypothetical protein C8Q78DRAFT_1058174 [Trametes maxima]|nr:hypothetical protein C8Q78DRAFT_1058174 [Trametes maxima]